ncbi:hypothetical protein [Geochorda subterranea]|uniref:Uncharacterized protein n=1 Tax=Geochorda subterranea TaxID=3109564 RepID=A0ABZ1BT94_9FIRM|nr:hypothetical protein [Limnochorda sp. LNt]WRP15751.1 hypothetical protein VLY81_06245 [Limnochorda sp. LNt]
MTAWDWVLSSIQAFGTVGLLWVTYQYVLETRRLVAATRQQVAESARSALVVETLVEQPTPDGTNFHILLRNYGSRPAMDVQVFVAADRVGLTGEGSIVAKVIKPLAPKLLYDVAIQGLRPGQVVTLVRDPLSREHPVLVPALVVTTEVDNQVSPWRGEALGEDVILALTYQDPIGSKRWLVYQQRPGAALQIDGEGDLRIGGRAIEGPVSLPTRWFAKGQSPQ